MRQCQSYAYLIVEAEPEQYDRFLCFRCVLPPENRRRSGAGRGRDFLVGRSVIEVKGMGKRFSSADYRQVAIYRLLSYGASVEVRGEEWHDFILLDPRSGEKLTVQYDELLSLVGGGRTKIDAL